MDRRGFLTTAGIAGIVGLAGCVQAPNVDGEGAGTTPDGTTPDGGGGTGNGTATDGGTTAGGAGGGAPNTVDMVTDGSEFYFDPIGLFVEPGETISFVIDSGAHSSTAYAEGTGGAETTRIPDGAEPWDSGTLTEQGASFDHTFETTGTYDYFCIPHKSLGMVGRLVVGEPGGVEGNPPDGEVPSEQTIVEQRVVSYDEFSG